MRKPAVLLSLLLALSVSAESGGGPLFEDVTEASGLPMDAPAGRVAFADLDRDGRPDVLLDRTQVWMNRGRKFVRSDRDGVLQPKDLRRADVVQVGDVNNDGVPDLFLGRSTDLSNDKFKDEGLRSEIWLGDGKGGWKKAERSGVGNYAETTVSACFVDVNNDGALDLFVANAYTAYGKSLEAFPSRLYLGKGDGTFSDATKAAKLELSPSVGQKDSRRPAYGCAHTDWNNDGRQDLLVMTYGRQANRLWRNNQDGTFTDVGVETTFDADADRSGKYPDVVKQKMGRTDEPEFRAHGNNFDCAVADFDGDGDMDCFIATIAHGWAGTSSDPSMLLENLGSKEGFKFRREPERIPREPVTLNTNHGDLHAGWMDVDNDGCLDLLVASSDYPDEQILHLYRQDPDGTFEDWTGRLGFTWVSPGQISLGDFDRDGATDILVGRSHMRLSGEQRRENPMRPGLLRNLCAARAGNRFLNLRLKGAKGKSNPDAVGARVTVWTGDRRQTREVYGGLGVGGHRDDTDCRFGVGKAEKADRIEVRWPDAKGTVQEFLNVDTNAFYTLEQGGTLKAEKP